MTETRRMTMKPATSTTERASVAWRKRRVMFTSCVIIVSCAVAIALATPNSGVLSNVLSRATFARFHVESQIASQSGHFEVELHTTGVTDVVTQTVTLAPGGYSGWHSHPGPAILSVVSGTLTFYEAVDRTCTPHVFPNGTGFVEPGGDVHIARNESTENLTVNVTYIIPQNAPQRIDQPSPGNCPF